jgi:hypothetical protein
MPIVVTTEMGVQEFTYTSMIEHAAERGRHNEYSRLAVENGLSKVSADSGGEKAMLQLIAYRKTHFANITNVRIDPK